ncbi:MAG: DegT/DnrJ/EryC1/StrS family aminotransferase [Prevotellaceae bacterium]|jgi:dTDP-4-amino-4,6-dideoxygalactose transaminase|nr:DegT/DnrJ/EryC1/StrS family aminotransferase [Prevotellaceae bacterium]
MKYFDLQAINQSFEPELSDAVRQVLRSGWYLHGEATARFEEQFARYCRAPHCIGTGNGLDALTLIFLAYRELGQMQAGDEVIVPANTYIATILAVMRAGLKPVLCEPLAETCNLSPVEAEKLITPRTRALLPVHLYGLPADSPSFARLARRYQLKVIEDAAQAHGALSDGHPAADATAYSFYPAKNLGALGDGGAVVTHDSELAAVVRSLSNYGSTEKYTFLYKGVNSRLDEVQAAALSVKLKRLDADNARRREIAQRYRAEIHWQAGGLSTTLLHRPMDERNVYHIFPLFSPQRDALQHHLAAHHIETLIHYPIPPHRQQALQQEYVHLHLPVTEKLSSEELSLPISPLLSEKEVTHVIDCVNGFV